MPGPDPLQTLAGVGEEELLARIFPYLPGGPGVILGPGDDTALVAAPGRSVLATTDAMVRQRDWRDDWSSGADVGAKVVAQNCADIAAMGGVPTGLLVTLIAEPATRAVSSPGPRITPGPPGRCGKIRASSSSSPTPASVWSGSGPGM